MFQGCPKDTTAYSLTKCTLLRSSILKTQPLLAPSFHLAHIPIPPLPAVANCTSLTALVDDIYDNATALESGSLSYTIVLACNGDFTGCDASESLSLGGRAKVTITADKGCLEGNKRPRLTVDPNGDESDAPFLAFDGYYSYSECDVCHGF